MSLLIRIARDGAGLEVETPAGTSIRLPDDERAGALLMRLLLAQEQGTPQGVGTLASPTQETIEQWLARGGTIKRIGETAKRTAQAITLAEARTRIRCPPRFPLPPEANEMPLLKQTRIFRSDLRANREARYVFGDNEARVGLAGQAAEMRGEPNAIGIATLAAPGLYWGDSDEAFADQRLVLVWDFVPVREALAQGRLVIWPLDGIGTGFAHLARYAPRTEELLRDTISLMFRQYALPARMETPE